MADGRMRPGDANVARLKPRDREYTVRDTRVPALGVRVAPGGSRSRVRHTGSGRVTLGPTAGVKSSRPASPRLLHKPAQLRVNQAAAFGIEGYVGGFPSRPS